MMDRDSENFNSGFYSGIIIGFVIFGFFSIMPFTDRSKYNKAIEECEKDLPRNQYCKVIGVPYAK